MSPASLLGALLLFHSALAQIRPDPLPIAHWPLIDSAADITPNPLSTRAHDIGWHPRGGAIFNGRSSHLAVDPDPRLQTGTNDFSIALWLHLDAQLVDSPGDLVSLFDPVSRTGFHLGIQDQSATCTSTANTRNLFFGMDAGTDPVWTDCGRPGNNLMVYALTVFKGHLYAGTFEHGAHESGHVYRHTGGTNWIDCGSPDPANTVSALAVLDGHLYAGVSSYSGVGSHIAPSPNTHPGGRVYRHAGGKRWIPCGQVCDAGMIWGMTVFQGKLHVSAMDLPPKHLTTPRQGLYRYEGGTRWSWLGNPGGRIAPITVSDGHLFAGGFNGGALGGVFRHEGGTNWSPYGSPPNVDQTYSFAMYRGTLHSGTWKEGRVYRHDAPLAWKDLGQLGSELEVMGLTPFNGKLYGGTLPLAQVYRFDDSHWTLTGRLDFSSVEYRRAWSMAVHQGRLFCGILPSGHVHALQAGIAVSHDSALPPGWRHIVATRTGSRLQLHVDGRQVAQSTPFNPADFDLSTPVPLRIGLGEHDHLNGRLRDVRLYHHALDTRTIRRLSRFPR
jgi:hypothetical protein